MEKDNARAGEGSVQSLLLGLAVGDALGVPVEFKKRGTFHVDGMEGYGTHNQPPGTWSDDSSLALALADALAEDAISMEAIARRFIAWLDEGRFTPHGEAFDIGNATSRALGRLKKGVAPEDAGGKNMFDNGNGSLMRIAPLVFFLPDLPLADRLELCRKVSSITHAHPISILACFIYLEYLMLLRGIDKSEAYADLRENFKRYAPLLDEAALPHFDRILKRNLAQLPEDEIKSSGYVVDTLEAAMWCFLKTGNYAEAVLKAVNLGEDADTVGAVTGAMAGLYYGEGEIPPEWLAALASRKEICAIANQLRKRLGLS